VLRHSIFSGNWRVIPEYVLLSAEEVIKAYVIRDGSQACHAGFLPRRFSEAKRYMNKMAIVIEDLRESDNTQKQSWKQKKKQYKCRNKPLDMSNVIDFNMAEKWIEKGIIACHDSMYFEFQIYKLHGEYHEGFYIIFQFKAF